MPGRLDFFPLYPNPGMVKNENESIGVSAGDVSMSTDNIGTDPGLCGIGESDFLVW